MFATAVQCSYDQHAGRNKIPLRGKLIFRLALKLSLRLNAKMKLRPYRKAQGLTLATLAARIGCSVPMLSDVERGKRTPSLRLVARIEAATGRLVTARDFMDAAADARRVA